MIDFGMVVSTTPSDSIIATIMSKAGLRFHGPNRPKPDTEASNRRGCYQRNTSDPKPRFSWMPGRERSTSMSPARTRVSSTSLSRILRHGWRSREDDGTGAAVVRGAPGMLRQGSDEGAVEGVAPLGAMHGNDGCRTLHVLPGP